WPQTFVEDSNLKIQVSALRRALGDGQAGNRYVVTVPGRGYNFVAPVSLEERPQAPPPPTAALHNLPLAVTRMIGRDEAVSALVSRLSRQRLVTIVGPGGIGKTTVATVLGLDIRAEDPLPGLIADLRDKQMLLLLDNCEHVIEAAASLTAAA